MNAHAPAPPGLVCGQCGTTANVDVVCHHCGRPLCPRHRLYRKDGVFKKVDDKKARQDGKRVSAYHCRECWRKYHSIWGFLYR